MTSTHTVQELSDQLSIRQLIDAYSHHADRRNPAAQAALFTENARVSVYNGDPATTEPVQVLNGRAELEAAFSGLSAYQATTHFNGQSTITVDGDTAGGETYCLAHHVYEVDGVRTLLVMSIRYHETLERVDGHWLFSDRWLIIDWTDSRPSNPNRTPTGRSGRHAARPPSATREPDPPPGPPGRSPFLGPPSRPGSSNGGTGAGAREPSPRRRTASRRERGPRTAAAPAAVAAVTASVSSGSSMSSGSRTGPRHTTRVCDPVRSVTGEPTR